MSEYDRYPEVGWVDRAGNVRHYPSGYSPAELLRTSPDGLDPTGPLVDLTEPDPRERFTTLDEVSPQDKPKLVKDQPFFYKWFVIIPVLAIVAAIGGKLAGYGFAAIYYDTIELFFKSGWHHLVPADWLRHPIRDVEFEKMAAFAAIQVIVYNFAKHWPRKPANRLDRIEGFLRVPNARIENQGLVPLILSPFWLLLYSGIGFAIFMTGLWVGGYTPAYPAGWLITLIGLFASFVFGRRIAKGVAYHGQRVIIRERIEDGRTRPAWWMLWPLRWRFEWNIAHPETRVKPNRRWKNYKLQRFVHHATLVLVLLAGLFLIGQGFVILYQAAHGPIAWGAAWNAIKYGVTAWL